MLKNLCNSVAALDGRSYLCSRICSWAKAVCEEGLLSHQMLESGFIHSSFSREYRNLMVCISTVNADSDRDNKFRTMLLRSQKLIFGEGLGAYTDWT